MPRRLTNFSFAGIKSVFRSQFLWRIYAATTITVVAALLTVAIVFLVRSPVLLDTQTNELLTSLIIATIAGAVVALGLGFLLAQGVQSTLSEITKVAQNLAKGDFGARVKNLAEDEFGMMGLTLNLLGEEISDRIATLSQERTQLAALFAGMVEGIVAIGDDDRVLFANGAADRLLRTSASVSRGRQINDVQGLGLLLPVVIQCRTEKRRKHTELTLGDGENLIVLETHASPFKGEQTAGVVVVLHDVTELRRLERVRRDFVANVSHELKTPLTSIKGYVETLQSGAKSDPVVLDRFLQRIDVNVGRLVELVQDILSLASIENQDGTLRKSAVDLGLLLQNSIDHHEHAVSRKNIRLKININEHVIIQADREAMRQVIDNLLTNAIKYTPEGGEVRITLLKSESNAVLKVEDTGIGIPAEHHARIFERFYRVDKSRSREEGGTGLGLSIVKHLVHSMKGKVSVSSEPGMGSVFTVQMNLQGRT